MSLCAPYYSKDNVTLYHGDNVAVMSEMAAESIDLVVTSPPYDNLRAYDGYSWDFEQVAQQLWRIIKPGGVVVWVVNDATVDGSETGTSFRQALRFMEIGFRLHDTMIWHRIGAFPESNRYHPSFEFMFVLSNGQPSTFNCIKDRQTTTGGVESASRMERRSDGTIRRPERKYVRAEAVSRNNIWDIKAGWGQSSEEKYAFEHPAIFPEALARDHILSWSNEGDTVLDCFSGSGTTVKMAKLMGRKAVGIEISEKYCEIAVNRLRQRVLNFEEAAQ